MPPKTKNVRTKKQGQGFLDVPRNLLGNLVKSNMVKGLTNKGLEALGTAIAGEGMKRNMRPVVNKTGGLAFIQKTGGMMTPQKPVYTVSSKMKK